MADEDQPLVSVVVVAYRQPAFLNEALQSVARQTYPAVETIVVDDASGELYTSQYRLPPGARLLVHPARGAKAALTRNTGLRAATGRYVAFLDQDDLWHPEKLACQVEQMRRQPDAVLTFCHLQYVDATLRPLDRQRPPPALKRDPLRQMLTRNLIRTPSQVLMCRQTLDRIGWFDETIRGSADWEMWIRAAAAGRVLRDPRVMTLYRQHDQQWSRDRLMLRHGAVRVMEKTATWLPATRPELGAVLRRRHARWLRELARAQLDSALPQERAQAMSTLRRAVAAWPLSIKSYAQMLRAALVRRCPQPGADSV